MNRHVIVNIGVFRPILEVIQKFVDKGYIFDRDYVCYSRETAWKAKLKKFKKFADPNDKHLLKVIQLIMWQQR